MKLTFLHTLIDCSKRMCPSTGQAISNTSDRLAVNKRGGRVHRFWFSLYGNRSVASDASVRSRFTPYFPFPHRTDNADA
jgi:hypothetical protein